MVLISFWCVYIKRTSMVMALKFLVGQHPLEGLFKLRLQDCTVPELLIQ